MGDFPQVSISHSEDRVNLKKGGRKCYQGEPTAFFPLSQEPKLARIQKEVKVDVPKAKRYNLKRSES